MNGVSVQKNNDSTKELNVKDLSIMNNSNHNDDDDDDDVEIDENSTHLIELNNRIKNDFMSHCLSLLQKDKNTQECVQIIWHKYLQCIGDIAMISAFFDTLPFNIKQSVLPKYQDQNIQWLKNIFHINGDTLLYSISYYETYLHVIRYALKLSYNENDFLNKKAIIYVSKDFNKSLKNDLLLSLSNITFKHVQNDVKREDMIDVNQLEQLIKQDINDSQSFPLMIIANAGTTLLGHCDELATIKQISDQYDLWLHVTGDLLGSLALFSKINDDVDIGCDSLTLDIVKLFGIQNLPYLTVFIQPIEVLQDKQADLNSTTDERLTTDNSSTISTSSTNVSSAAAAANQNNNSFEIQPFNDVILHSSSIHFLSIWSISQRCTKDDVIYHMKRSFDLANLLINRLKQIKTIRILNDNDNQGIYTYKRICEGAAPDEPLPKTVLIFRYETMDVPEIQNMEDVDGYIDLLNLWLFDKLSQEYPRMNLDLLKSIHFNIIKSDDSQNNRRAVHAMRFAPLENILDIIEENDIQTFIDDVQRYTDILLSTMTARACLPSRIKTFNNLTSISMPNWAGIGAIRYIPSYTNTDQQSENSSYDVNIIQSELAKNLQTNDSAFSLGVESNETNPFYYLRLGMIRKCDDLDILLQKISDAGQETETDLKYVADMADKIKEGIDKVQKDLQDENQRILAEDGILRQLPVISSIMSWWSPPPSATPLATKGRTFDLNSGRIESTEDIYVNRMQIKRQFSQTPTHNNNEINLPPINNDKPINSTDTNSEQNHNQ